MNMKELIAYKAQKKKENAAKWNTMKQEDGECKGLTQVEYNNLTHKQKSSTTRRTHSRGNLWNHQNLANVKADMKIYIG